MKSTILAGWGLHANPLSGNASYEPAEGYHPVEAGQQRWNGCRKQPQVRVLSISHSSLQRRV